MVNEKSWFGASKERMHEVYTYYWKLFSAFCRIHWLDRTEYMCNVMTKQAACLVLQPAFSKWSYF